MDIKPIAHIETDFSSKFGIPRQSGLASELQARIVFEPTYRRMEALRGIEDFDYLWLIWDFSQAHQEPGKWDATVKPPRLGGNQRMGVFATRSPNRPNSLGLSSVRLLKVEEDAELGPVLYVAGADLANNTPIYDIKPYLPYTDAHPEARGGFTDNTELPHLEVLDPHNLISLYVPDQLQAGLLQCLALDPRPAYHDDPQRRYGLGFGGFDIRFTVNQQEQSLTIVEIVPE